MFYNVPMSKRTLNPFILTFFLSISALAAPEDVYKSLGLSEGKVISLSESVDLCNSGPFQFVGEGDEKVLMMGTNITFDLPTKDKITAKADLESCAEDSHSKLLGKKLSMITIIHTCPKKDKKLEGVTEESIEVNAQRIKYLRKSGKEKTECDFKWVPNEKN